MSRLILKTPILENDPGIIGLINDSINSYEIVQLCSNTIN